MEEKLQELLYGHETLLAFSASHELYEDASLDQYLEEGYEIIPCGGLSSFWKNIKQFVKKHKKEIIIGTILVVAAVTVTAGVLAVHAASSSELGSLQSSSSTKNSTPLPTDKEKPAFAEILEESAAAFKAQVIEEEFFDPPASGEGLSLEETGQALGLACAYDYFDQFQQLSYAPQFRRDLYPS